MADHVTQPMQQLVIEGIDPLKTPDPYKFACEEAKRKMPAGHAISGVKMATGLDKKFTATVFYHEDKPARAPQP
jgi:hypothetical protein